MYGIRLQRGDRKILWIWFLMEFGTFLLKKIADLWRFGV
jgi:hypothetical protein